MAVTITYDHKGGYDTWCSRKIRGNPAKYAEYIRLRLDDFKDKCDHLEICINKLFSTQSKMSILSGRTVKLSRLCGLINVKGHNSTEAMLDGACHYQDRLDMMEDVDTHMRDKMAKRDAWQDVHLCLEGQYGDSERTTMVNDICRLAESQDHICDDYATHKHVEKFVNEQIEHLQCTCKSLHKETHEHAELSTPLLIGLAAGGIVFLLLLFAMIYCCWRRKRNKKKKRKPNVIYLPAPNSDGYPVYQEIFEQMSPGSPPPSLPSRYGSRPLPGQPAMDECEYLEPVQAAQNSYRAKAPLPLNRLVNNPGYDRPPEYSETDTTYEDAVDMGAEQDAYFEPISTPKSNTEQTAGYDALDNSRGEEDSTNLPAGQYQPLDGGESEEYQPFGGGQSEEYQPLDGGQSEEYQPLEDIDPSSIPLGPDPASRTKKDDRATESEYFELEKVDEAVEKVRVETTL